MRSLELRCPKGLGWHNFTAFNCASLHDSHSRTWDLKCIEGVCRLCLELNCMYGMRRIVTIVHTETNHSMDAKWLYYFQLINQSIMNF